MKLFKRLLAPLMAILMIVVCMIPSFALPKTYRNYAVLGDSVPTGYMLEGYRFAGRNKALWPVVKGSFPQYVAEGVHATNIYMMAHSGYRTADLRRVLDPSFHGDYFNNRRLPVEPGTRTIDEKALQNLHEKVTKYIAQSDLINIHIGGNDSFQAAIILSEMLQENQLAVEDREFLENIDFETVEQDLARYADNTETLARLVQMELASVTNFVLNFNACIKLIHDINPDAKIVVIGLYNPLDITKVAGIPLGPLVEPLIAFFNTHMAVGCPYSRYYTFVRPRNLDTYVGTGQIFANPDQPFDVHPTPLGHRQLADQILAVL